MTILISVEEGLRCLREGGVIGYPTEGVYGLGCDIRNKEAIQRILNLKGRHVSKGFIVLVHDWDQLKQLIQPLPIEAKSYIQQIWPGPVTFLCPKAESIPDDLTGGKPQIAVRMTAHPVAHALCQESPIVSTSANLSNSPPIRTIDAFLNTFSSVDGLVLGELGGQHGPTAIIDALTQAQFR